MVGCLRFYLNRAYDFAAFFCAFHKHFFKKWKSHIVRARRRYEVSAAFYKFHAQHIDVFVASVCVLDFACALAECGRIENNEVEFFAVVFVLSQCVENIGALGFYVCKTVQRGVFFDV